MLTRRLHMLAEKAGTNSTLVTTQVTTAWLLALAFLLQVAFSTFVSGIGLSMPGKATASSPRTPYWHTSALIGDSFYMQGPPLPYVNALWMKFMGVSWSSGKFFAVVLTALLGTLMAEHVSSQLRQGLAAMATVVLFAFKTLVFASYPAAKTHFGGAGSVRGLHGD